MRNSVWIVASVVAWGGLAHAQGNDPSVPEQKQALLDWEAAGKLYKEISSAVHPYTPNGPFGGTIREKHEERLAFIEGYQLSTQPALEAQLEAFEEKYGGSPEAVIKRYQELLPSYAGYRIPKENEALFVKISNTYVEPDRLIRETRAELAGLQETRVQSADGLVTQAKPMIDLLESTSPDQLGNRLRNLETELRFAVRYDPNNAEAKQLLADVERRIGESGKILEEWLDSRTFPDPIANFAGPGNADKLADSCLQWFNSSPEWGGKGGPERPITVVVTGDWVTTRRNILGQSIQWGLPIYLAVWREAEPKIARVFSLTMITKIGLDVPKAAPWTGCLVGASYPMRRSNVPGGGSGGSSSDGDGGSDSDGGGDSDSDGGGDSDSDGGGDSDSDGDSDSGDVEDPAGFGAMGFLFGFGCCFVVLAAAGVGAFFVVQKSKQAPPADAGGAPPPAAPPAPPADAGGTPPTPPAPPTAPPPPAPPA